MSRGSPTKGNSIGLPLVGINFWASAYPTQTATPPNFSKFENVRIYGPYPPGVHRPLMFLNPSNMSFTTYFSSSLTAKLSTGTIIGNGYVIGHYLTDSIIDRKSDVREDH